MNDDDLRLLESDGGMNLVQKMISLGYFSDSSKLASSRTTDANDAEALIFLSDESPDQGCVTFSHLVQEIENHIQLSSGRLSLTQIAKKFTVDIKNVEHAIEVEHLKSKKLFIKVGNEVISSSHLDGLMQVVNARLNSSSSGRILLSDIAIHIFNLPIEVTIREILNRATALQGILLNNHKEIISYSYDSMIQAQIHGVFLAISTPTSLSNLQKRYAWPSNFIKKSIMDNTTTTIINSLSQYVANKCSDHTFPGVFNPSNDIFTPYIYVKQQRKAVKDFFASNAYITESQGQSLGLTTASHKMLDYICKLQHLQFQKNDDKNDEVNTEQIKDIILELPRSKVVFDPKVILSALEGVLVSECLPNRSFVDLRMQLPEGFLSACEDELDVKFLIDYCAQSANKTDRETPILSNITTEGVIVMSLGEVLYVSPGMIEDVNEKILPSLIDEYAKLRAKEMNASSESSNLEQDAKTNDIISIHFTGKSSSSEKSKKRGKRGKQFKSKHDDVESPSNDVLTETSVAQPSLSKSKKLSAKEKRRLKAKASASNKDASNNSLQIDPGIIPIMTVASAIAETYPELSELQTTSNDMDFTDTNVPAPIWEIAADDEDGPLYQFTRLIISIPKLAELCAKAVQAEYQKLQNSKRLTTKTNSSNSRHENANYARKIEESFEDSTCFANACYLLQMMNKSIISLQESIHLNQANTTNDPAFVDTTLSNQTAIFEQMLLRCASNFARRITEYCLFKYDVDESIFTFTENKSDSENDNREDISDDQNHGLPGFCKPVDMSIVDFPAIFLSSKKIYEGNNNVLNVLKIIRDELPREVGSAVAQMWILCGPEFYQGGSNSHEETSAVVGSNSSEAFLKHVEDSCLTICGLPFKILDKKSEKQAMFSRRMELKQNLEKAEDPHVILELTILILFQQVKHLSIAGNFITSTILALLLKEKKISTFVGEQLNSLVKSLNEKILVENQLLDQIKEFGLCKDISKFESTN